MTMTTRSSAGRWLRLAGILCTMGTALLSFGCSATGIVHADDGGVTAIEATLSEYSINLSRLEVPGGQVHVSVANVGAKRHNLRVVGNGVDIKTRDLKAGQSTELNLTFDDPGVYTVFCDLADHADLGMSLRLTVTGLESAGLESAGLESAGLESGALVAG